MQWEEGWWQRMEGRRRKEERERERESRILHGRGWVGKKEGGREGGKEEGEHAHAYVCGVCPFPTNGGREGGRVNA